MSPSGAGGPPAACWTDSHCHLDEETDPAAVLERAAGARVARLVCIGTALASSRRALEIARSFSDAGAGEPEGDPDPSLGAPAEAGCRDRRPLVWATIGLHPHDAAQGLDPVALLLEASLRTGRDAEARLPAGSVVAVGECGLDYHYDRSPRAVQREVFAEQIALARRHGLALVVHTREAWDDTLDLLAAVGTPERTVVHCFSGGVEEARRCLELGAYLSFSGIVTFKRAEEVRAAAAYCPADRLLVETDSPFLAPVPHRGAPNEPAYVALVGAELARLRGVEHAELAALTSANAASAFRI